MHPTPTLRSSLTRSRPGLIVLAALVLTALLGLGVDRASAADTSASATVGGVTFTARGLSVTVSGTTATATATFSASSSVVAQSYSVCVRSSSGANYDFSHRLESPLSTTGTVLTRTQTLPLGTYLYYPCVKYANTWIGLGTSGKVTVTGAAATPTPTPTATSGANLAASVVPASTTIAGVTFSVTNLSVTANGTSVTGSASFSASSSVVAQSYSICVRDSARANKDFYHRLQSPLSTTAVLFSRTQTLPIGTYTYYPCLEYNNTWAIIGETRTLQVTGAVSTPAATATPTPTPTVTATPQPMPVGDLTGWKQVLAEDFTTPVALGSWSTSSYASRWYGYSGYNDTSGNGTYAPDKVMSVKDGALDWSIRTEDGKHYVSAMVPRNPNSGWGQTYGRYSFRFRSDLLPGYKFVGLLWPDSDNWAAGEIDFPEANNLTDSGELYANMYSVGNLTTKQPGAAHRISTITPLAGSGWHTATIEWAPGSVTYYLDGTNLGSHTVGVPSSSFHLVLQLETAVTGPAPADSVAGHLQIDWVTMYERC